MTMNRLCHRYWLSALFMALLCLAHVCSIRADETSMFVTGNDLVLEGKYTEALAAFETFVKENPDHRLVPAATWTMANIHLIIEKDYQQAASLFQKILDEYQDTEWESFGYDRLGSCFEGLEDWDKAADVYQTATKRIGTLGEGPENQARLRDIRQRMLLCYQNLDDHERIIGMYKQSLSENPAGPTAPEDQFNLARTYLTMESPKAAAENFALVVDRYPSSPLAQQVQAHQSKFLITEIGYDWSAFTTYLTGLELAQQGQYEKALATLDEAIQARPNSGTAMAALIHKDIIDYSQTGDAALLLEKFTTAQQAFPYGLGGIAADRWMYFLRLIADAQAILQSTPDDAGLYVRMSQGYLQTGAYQPGIDALKKAISLTPNSPDACNLLGYCYLGARQYDEAMSAFQMLINIDPDNPNSYDSMAEGCYAKGDTTRAIEFYQKSLTVDSSFTNPYFMLGRIYQDLGQKEKAIQHLEMYLELDSDGYQAQNARRMLNQLKPPESGATEQ